MGIDKEGYWWTVIQLSAFFSDKYYWDEHHVLKSNVKVLLGKSYFGFMVILLSLEHF